MKKSLLFLSLTFILSLTSCGSKKKNMNDQQEPSEPPKEQKSFLLDGNIVNNIQWDLNDFPVKKIVDFKDGLIALTEKHSTLDSRHLRLIHILYSDKSTITIDTSSIEKLIGTKNYTITDIAKKSNSGSGIWLTVTSNDKVLSHYIFSLEIDKKQTNLKLVHTYPLEQKSNDSIFAMSYEPNLDTLDVSAIASWNDDLAIAVRNNIGEVFVKQLQITPEGTLKETSIQKVTSKLCRVRIMMDGGSYDVMDQLRRPYHLYITYNDQGKLFFANMTRNCDIENNNNEFKQRQLSLLEKDIYEGVLTLELARNGSVVKFNVSKLGYEGLLFDLLPQENDISFIGLNREGTNLKSHVVIGSTSGEFTAIEVPDHSASGQTITKLNKDRVLIAGSHNWQQNPSGVSISGGNCYIAQFDLKGKKISILQSFKQFDSRCEVRDLISISNDVTCIAIMSNGPDTHKADADTSLLKANGKVFCQKLDESKK